MKKVLIVLFSIFSCTNNNSNFITYHEHEKLGFYLYNNGNHGDTTMKINISANRIVDTVPLITVNNNAPDTPYFSPTGFSFSGIKPNKSCYYKIIYANDTLADSVFLPKTIDSLFVNDLFLSEDSNSIPVVLDYNCDSLKLHWKDNRKPDYYRVYLYSDLFLEGSQTIITHDTCVTVKIKWSKYIQGPDINIRGEGSFRIDKIFQKSISAEPWADKISREMFIYYQIESPFYAVGVIYTRVKTITQ